MQAGVPIVPIVIHNALDVAPKGDFIFRPATVEVDVLAPIDTSDWTVGTIDEHVAEVRALYLDALGQEDEAEPSPRKAKSGKAAAEKKKPAGKKAPAKKKPAAKKAAVKKKAAAKKRPAAAKTAVKKPAGKKAAAKKKAPAKPLRAKRAGKVKPKSAGAKS